MEWELLLVYYIEDNTWVRVYMQFLLESPTYKLNTRRKIPYLQAAVILFIIQTY